MIDFRKYAWIYALGGIAALQAMKYDVLSFPPLAKIYLGYTLSFITIACIFFAGGPYAMALFKKIIELNRETKNGLDNGKKNGV